MYGIAPLRVRVVGAPHDVLDPEVAAQRRLARAQEAGADPEVAGEVLGRRHRHLRGSGAEEVGLRRVGRRHAAVEPVERLEATGQPGHALLGDGEAKRRVALEHPGEDEVPHGAVAEPGDLDQHHRPRRLVLAVVGQGAPAVDVDGHVEVGADLPERLVVVLPQRRQVRVRRDGGQQDAPERPVEGLWPPTAPRRPRRPCRWRRPARCRHAGPARPRRSRPATGCAPARRPSGARSPRASGGSATRLPSAKKGGTVLGKRTSAAMPSDSVSARRRSLFQLR